ncbi:hypothetical protein DFH29DRAFT_947136 [Suillus ampliporus]|nr:hypothetical protein DFH29DRAFT_947136 [Suillus ampliporus]
MNPAGFFKGDTMMEVFAVLANSNDVNQVRKAVILYIARKKQKGRSEQHIQDKLLLLEDKFKHIEAWHPAFRDARVLFQLPKSKHIPLPEFVIREQQETELLRQIDMGLLPSTFRLSASSSCSSSTPSSWDGPPPNLQDLPYVLPAYPWEDRNPESRVHVPSSPGHIIPSNMLSMLSEYDESEGDEEIITFLSELKQS